MALFIAPSPLRGLALKAVRSRTLCKTRKLVPTQRPHRLVALSRIFLHAQNPALPKGAGCPIITHEITVSFLFRIQKKAGAFELPSTRHEDPQERFNIL